MRASEYELTPGAPSFSRSLREVFRSEMHLTNMLRASFQLLALLLAFQCATAQQEPGFTSQANRPCDNAGERQER